MATRHKPLPVTDETADEIVSERAAVRQEAGQANTPDTFASYLTSHREELLARFKQAQQALASEDPVRIRQLGNEARRSHAKAIVDQYPK